MMLVLAMVLAMPGVAAGQEGAGPGVRGALYESPTFGWLLTAPAPDWRITGAESAGGVDTVFLTSDLGDSAHASIVSKVDAGSGAAGCIQGLVAALATAFPDAPLQGWHEPDVAFSDAGADQQDAYARVVRGGDPGRDLLAYLSCTRGPDGLLIGETLLRSARDLENGPALPLLTPLWPGLGHTGRPRASQSANDDAAPGVVRFIDRYTDQFPFSCVRQEELSVPAEPPPPERAWFGCDGRIVNVDTAPATIDLARFMLGCYQAHVPGAAASPDCPTDLVSPTAYQVLQAPPGTGGPTITLAPGEFADVALWYALPEGDVPWDILFVSPDRIVQVGPTFFTEGTGSRPRIRIAR